MPQGIVVVTVVVTVIPLHQWLEILADARPPSASVLSLLFDDAKSDDARHGAPDFQAV